MQNANRAISNGKPRTQLWDRPVPYDAEAEIGVLGSIMLMPSVLLEVSAVLESDDFHDPHHRQFYNCMLAMHEAGLPIDPTLLVDELRTGGLYEAIGGAAYIGKVLHAVPSAAHAVYYAGVVSEKATLRRLIEAATEIIRDAYNDQIEPVDQVAHAEHLIHAVAQRAAGSIGDARLLADVADDVLAEMNASLASHGMPGFYSGIGHLDQNLGPIMPGELTILAARPGNGKTAIAMQYAANATSDGKRVFFASLEMPQVEIARREIAREAGVDSRKLRSMVDIQHAEIDAMHETVAAVKTRNPRLWLWRKARATCQQIRAAARRIMQSDGCDLIIVDHIGWIAPSGPEKYEDRRTQIGMFTKSLKDIANELHAGLLVLCQLNRDAQDKMPTLANLRDSGAIEEDADAVLFLFHPPGAGANMSAFSPREAILNVGKHRHAAMADIRMSWTPAETRFGEPLGELPP